MIRAAYAAIVAAAVLLIFALGFYVSEQQSRGAVTELNCYHRAAEFPDGVFSLRFVASVCALRGQP